MIISNKSWHYRLVKYLDKHYEPTNLCSYFWKVVAYTIFTLLVSVFAVSFGLFFAITMGAPIAAGIFWIFTGGFPSWAPIAYFGTICWFVIALGLIGVSCEAFIKNRKKTVIIKPDGLVKSYWKNFKSKSCAIIEVRKD